MNVTEIGFVILMSAPNKLKDKQKSAFVLYCNVAMVYYLYNLLDPQSSRTTTYDTHHE
jgi:hypothetical protein